MRVALVQAMLGRREPPVMPLGSGVLAAALAGHEVAVIDPNLSGEPAVYLDSSLRSFQPSFVGISMRNADTTQAGDPWSYLPAFVSTVAAARAACPGSVIVAGGAAFSLFPGAVFSAVPGLDAAVAGEGEEVLPGMVEAAARGRPPTGIVPGVPVRRISSPLHAAMRVDAYRVWQHNLSVGVEVSRGCSSRCSYCSYPVIGGGVLRVRKPSEVVADMGALCEGWGIGHVFLCASILNPDPDSAAELFSALADRGLPMTWEGYFSPAGLDRGLAALAVRAGCTGISLSPDGGTAGAMRRMGKGFGPREVSRAIDAVRGFPSLRLSVSVFPRVPGGGLLETLASFARGAAWSLRAGRVLSRMRYGTIRLMPGTPLAEGLGDEDLLEPVFFVGTAAQASAHALLSRILGKDRGCTRR